MLVLLLPNADGVMVEPKADGCVVVEAKGNYEEEKG